jgi:WD40 repeat protein
MGTPMRSHSFTHGWRRSITAAIGVGVVLSVTLVLLAPAIAAAGSMAWVARYGTHKLETARAVAVSPDGARVYMTGISPRAETGSDAATLAYDAATGKRLWINRYAGPGDDGAWALALSPDGARVYITGFTPGSQGGQDYLTVAYDAATGSLVWAAAYHTSQLFGFANDVAVSPDGTRVYVTGDSAGDGSNTDYATVAYDATSGTQIWVRRYNGPGNFADGADAVAVSPDGDTVYVTGESYASGTDRDYATIAYDAATGAKTWLRRYNGPGNSDDEPSSVLVSPDGARVSVTGGSVGLGGTSNYDYATVTYDAASGQQLWARRYAGPGGSGDYAAGLAQSPDGATIYVTGLSPGVGTDTDFATLAYDAATGAKLWLRRYNGPGNFSDEARAIAVSPDGTQVYVTGGSVGATSDFDYATLAYDAATGAGLWKRRYDGPAGLRDDADSLAVSPDGSRLFVTGSSATYPYNDDYATVAYRTN